MTPIETAVRQLAEELHDENTDFWAGMTCGQADALAKVVAMAGYDEAAIRGLFWHCDRPEHTNADHKQIWTAQRDTDQYYKNPAAWTLAEVQVLELLPGK